MSFSVPFSVLNAGAQPGVIEESRLVLHFPGLPIPGNYEHVEARFEVDPAKAAQIGPTRNKWLGELVVGHPMPFPVLPKATVMRHILFETRWDAPVVQEVVVAELQLRVKKKWRVVSTWDNLHFDPNFVWPQLIYGATFTFAPVGRVRQGPRCKPENLHKYISSTDHDYSEMVRERAERQDGYDAQERNAGPSSPEP